MEIKTNSHTLLGFCIKPFEQKPCFKLYRFKVYDRGRINVLPPSDQKMNLNYQIDGREDEKLIVRIFLNDNGGIKKVRYYTWERFDEETADYLVKALMCKIDKTNQDKSKINIKRIVI